MIYFGHIILDGEWFLILVHFCILGSSGDCVHADVYSFLFVLMAPFITERLFV